MKNNNAEGTTKESLAEKAERLGVPLIPWFGSIQNDTPTPFHMTDDKAIPILAFICGKCGAEIMEKSVGCQDDWNCPVYANAMKMKNSLV